jgi:hypothetical protein
MDTDVEHYTDDKVRQLAEQAALRTLCNEQHWNQLVEQVGQMVHAGVIPDELATHMLEWIEHSKEDLKEAQWMNARVVHQFGNWVHATDDPKEKRRRKSLTGIAIIDAKMKMANLKDEEEMRAVVANWDYSGAFEDIDSWEWDGAKESTIEDEVKKFVADKLGIDVDQITAAGPGSQPVIKVARMIPDGKGGYTMKEVTPEEYEAVTGKSLEAEMREALRSNPDAIEIEIEGHPDGPKSLDDIIGHVRFKKDDEKDK